MPWQRGRSGSPLPLAGLTPNEHLAPLTPPQDLLPESPAATCLRPQTDQLAGCPTVCSSRPPLPTARRGWGRPAGAPSAAPRGPQTPTHVQSGGSGLVFLPEAAGRPARRPSSSPRRVTPSRRPAFSACRHVAGAVAGASLRSGRHAPMSIRGSPQFLRRGD